MAITKRNSVGVGREIRDEAFAKRLDSAMLTNPYAPEAHGRMAWLQRRLNEKFDLVVSLETVRKWFAGEMRPRHEKMTMIAQLLEVDEGWLSVGVTADLRPREKRARNSMADGTVNLVAGLIQMGGGYPAFPDENDRRADQDKIDLYAIIKGANYAINVVYCQGHEGCKFLVPNTYENVTVIGVVQTGPLTFDCYELDTATIDELGNRKGGKIELSLPESKKESLQIRTFSERSFGRG